MNRDERVEFFIANGWVDLPGAFSVEQAAPYVRRARERIRTAPRPDRRDEKGRPLGWTLSYETCFRFADFAPEAWELIVALVGGADKIAQGSDFDYSDGFVVALPNARGWKPAASEGFRWHIDRGDSDRICLDHLINGLVVYGLWSDVEPRGGGTFLAPGAVAPLVRFLARHPDGVDMTDIPFSRLLERRDPEFFEMTGALGTIYLAHPLLIHAPSLNARRVPRILSVKKLELSRPLVLSGAKCGRSPVEKATLRALGGGARARR